MTAGPRSATAESMLTSISNEMVQAKKRFFGKGPEGVKTYMMDDLCFTVMRGGLTRAEQTMLDAGHPDQVRAFRQLFQNEMSDHLMTAVSEITGRKVVTYQSQIMFDPHIVIEMFVFADRAPENTLEASARDQLDEP
jgi:uncharacterized protein YbcI